MYNVILTWFNKKYESQQATIEAVCYTLDLSLARGFSSINWEGW